jgi:hypothetical protein
MPDSFGVSGGVLDEGDGGDGMRDAIKSSKRFLTGRRKHRGKHLALEIKFRRISAGISKRRKRTA